MIKKSGTKSGRAETKGGKCRQLKCHLKKKATLQVIENAAFLYCYVVEMGGVEPPSKLYESMT